MIRWYHRWAVVVITWMGQPAQEPPEGYLTRRGAQGRSAQARHYGFQCGVVPASTLRRPRRRYSSSGTG